MKSGICFSLFTFHFSFPPTLHPVFYVIINKNVIGNQKGFLYLQS